MGWVSSHSWSVPSRDKVLEPSISLWSRAAPGGTSRGSQALAKLGVGAEETQMPAAELNSLGSPHLRTPLLHLLLSKA